MMEVSKNVVRNSGIFNEIFGIKRVLEILYAAVVCS